MQEHPNPTTAFEKDFESYDEGFLTKRMVDSYFDRCQLTDDFFCKLDQDGEPQTMTFIDFGENGTVPCCIPKSQITPGSDRRTILQKLLRLRDRVNAFYELAKAASLELQEGKLVFQEVIEEAVLVNNEPVIDEATKLPTKTKTTKDDRKAYQEVENSMIAFLDVLGNRINVCVESIFEENETQQVLQNLPPRVCEPFAQIVNSIEEAFFPKMFRFEQLVARGRERFQKQLAEQQRKDQEARFLYRFNALYQAIKAAISKTVQVAKVVLSHLSTLISYVWTNGLAHLKIVFRNLQGAANVIYTKVCLVQQENSRLLFYLYMKSYVEAHLKKYQKLYVVVKNSLEKLQGKRASSWVNYIGERVTTIINDLIDSVKSKHEQQEKLNETLLENATETDRKEANRQLETDKYVLQLIEQQKARLPTEAKYTFKDFSVDECSLWLWRMIVVCFDVIFKLTSMTCTLTQTASYITRRTSDGFKRFWSLLEGTASLVKESSPEEMQSKQLTKELSSGGNITEIKPSTEIKTELSEVINIETVSDDLVVKRYFERIASGENIVFTFSDKINETEKSKFLTKIEEATEQNRQRIKKKLEMEQEDQDFLNSPKVEFPEPNVSLDQQEVDNAITRDFGTGLTTRAESSGVQLGANKIANLMFRCFWYFSKSNVNVLPKAAFAEDQDLEKYRPANDEKQAQTEALKPALMPELRSVPNFARFAFCYARYKDVEQCADLVGDRPNYVVTGANDRLRRYTDYIRTEQESMREAKEVEAAKKLAQMPTEEEVKQDIASVVREVGGAESKVELGKPFEQLFGKGASQKAQEVQTPPRPETKPEVPKQTLIKRRDFSELLGAKVETTPTTIPSQSRPLIKRRDFSALLGSEEQTIPTTVPSQKAPSTLPSRPKFVIPDF